MKRFRFVFNDIINIKPQIVLLSIVMGIVIYLFHSSFLKFHPVGKGSFVSILTPEVLKKWNATPEHVKTGFMIHEFLKFDPQKNDFLISAIIWFEFDPTKVKIEDIETFSFTKGAINHKSKPVIEQKSASLTYVQYHIKVEFNSIFDYSMFPLDDHILYLNLTNNSVKAHKIIFDVDPSDFVVPEYVYLSGWHIVNHKPISGYTEYMLSQKDERSAAHPKVLFSIGIKKQNIRQLLLMFLPVMILFCLFLFTTSDEFPKRVRIMFSLLTAFMAHTIVVSHMAPDVGYFMLIDYLMLYLLGAIFLIFLINFLSTLPEEKMAKKTHVFLRAFAVVALHVGLIVLVYYLTHIYMGGV